MKMTRRQILTAIAALGLGSHRAQAASKPTRADRVVRSEEEWKKLLTPEQFAVLRREGTERAFTSALNDEKRAGTYHCAGCDRLQADLSAHRIPLRAMRGSPRPRV
jgi:peptide-methionine (R)-S-oxide reductase